MPTPTDIKLHQKSRRLEIGFDTGEVFELSCEFLRVHSPSAEVRGHSPDQAVLQLDKQDVNISAIEPVGNYAVKLVFDDGHDTGLYSWSYLYDLGKHREQYWQRYCEAVATNGKGETSEDAPTQESNLAEEAVAAEKSEKKPRTRRPRRSSAAKSKPTNGDGSLTELEVKPSSQDDASPPPLPKEQAAESGKSDSKESWSGASSSETEKPITVDSSVGSSVDSSKEESESSETSRRGWWQRRLS